MPLAKKRKFIRGRRTSGNQYVRRWDDWEVELARQLRDGGMRYREISRKLGIPAPTIRKWCSWHGRLGEGVPALD